MSASWPAPLSLSGVKTKQKVFFKIAKGAISAPGGDVNVVDVSLCLQSRILALGEVGRHLADVLLQERDLSSGKTTGHEHLVAIRLGPELAGLDAPASEHKQAVAKALQASKPHVVVLDEATHLGVCRGWVHTFHELLRSDVLRNFKGSVVICSAKESFALRGVCDERWAAASGQVRQTPCGGGPVIVEDAMAEPSASGKVALKKKKRDGDAGPEALLEEARVLSDAEFEEDIIDECRREGWTLTLLLDSSSSDGAGQLLGYLCYDVRPSPRADLHVHRVCTPRRLRGKGHGRLLMQWAMEKAQQLPDEECRVLTVAALDPVVAFYLKLGFTARGREEIVKGEDPQTVMDWNASMVSEAEAPSDDDGASSSSRNVT